MPVELRRQRDGSVRNSWYGRYEVNGKRFYLNLGVKVAGNPPASLSLREQGDARFEVSRGEAIAKLNSIIEEARSKQNSTRILVGLFVRAYWLSFRGFGFLRL